MSSRELRLSPFGTFLLGTYLLIVGLISVSVLIRLWPVAEKLQEMTAAPSEPASGSASAAAGTIPEAQFSFGNLTATLTTETSLILLVIVAAILGSLIHTTTSFASYVGNRRMKRSWVWWYVLRPFIGIALAIIFYAAVRAAFLTQNVSAGEVNLFGIVATGGLVGLFSKQATDKLKEVFDTLFRAAPGEGDATRGDPLNPAPTITSTDPPSPFQPGGGPTTVRLKGVGFTKESVVYVDNAERQSKYEEASGDLTIEFTKSELATSGKLEIKVKDAGGTSAPFSVEVE